MDEQPEPREGTLALDAGRQLRLRYRLVRKLRRKGQMDRLKSKGQMDRLKSLAEDEVSGLYYPTRLYQRHGVRQCVEGLASTARTLQIDHHFRCGLRR